MSHSIDYADFPAPGPWTEQAACKGHTDLFFGDNGYVPLAIRELCGSCPVKEECLAYALEHHVHGIWAGTSWSQRQRARGRRWRM